MADYTVKRQVLINKTVNGVPFQDAIYYTEDEFAAKNEADIQAEVDARFNAWVDTKAPVVDPRTPEEVLQDDIAALTEAKASMEVEAQKIADLIAEKQTELDAKG